MGQLIKKMGIQFLQGIKKYKIYIVSAVILSVIVFAGVLAGVGVAKGKIDAQEKTNQTSSKTVKKADKAKKSDRPKTSEKPKTSISEVVAQSRSSEAISSAKDVPASTVTKQWSKGLPQQEVATTTSQPKQTQESCPNQNVSKTVSQAQTQAETEQKAEAEHQTYLAQAQQIKQSLEAEGTQVNIIDPN